MEPWGYSAHIDLYNCDPEIIRSHERIVRYVDELCVEIGMKKFGSCIVQHFGEDEKVRGYTFYQMIETSSISGHLVDLTNEAHIDVFSCKRYDVSLPHHFSVNYFKAQKSKYQILER